MVGDAVEYARLLGLEPHSDDHQAKAILGDIDAAACREAFEFGRDGKPFFVSGPYDGPARCRKIVAALHENRGPGQYDDVAQFLSREMRFSQLFPADRVLELYGDVSPLDDEPPEPHFNT